MPVPDTTGLTVVWSGQSSDGPDGYEHVVDEIKLYSNGMLYINCPYFVGTPYNELTEDYLDYELVTSIVMNDSVTRIGSGGFWNLTTIVWPPNLTMIDSEAFRDCEALGPSITLPASITYLGGYAFENCYGLTEITIPEEVTGIETYALSGIWNLETINYGGSLSQWQAFGELGYEESVIVNYDYGQSQSPDDVIASDTWWTLTRGGHLEIFYNGDVPVYEKGYGDPNDINYRTEVCSRWAGLFVRSVTIGPLVTSLPMDCFAELVHLTAVTLSEGLESIDYGAFRNCPITSLVLPNSLTTIGYGAFLGCDL